MELSKRLGAFLALNMSLVPAVLAASNCNQLSGSVYTGSNDNKFDIQCDTSTVNGNIFAYYSDGDEFQDCVDRCDSVPICAVALYLAGSGDCALINSYQGTRSFNGNDVAIKRSLESVTTTSAEFTSSEALSTEVLSTEDLSTETSSIEATTTVVFSTEASSAEEVSSTEVSTTEYLSTTIPSIETTSSEDTTTVASSTGISSTEDSATETSNIESTSSEPSSTETSSTGEALSTEPSSVETSSAEATSTTTSAATTSTSSETSSESASTSQDSTLVTTTTAVPYTSTASIETSTDDCDDETSAIETSTTGVTSTVTGSEIQQTTVSTDRLDSSATTLQTLDLSTSASSENSDSTSSASSSTTAETQTYAPTSLQSSVTSAEASSSTSQASSSTTAETQNSVSTSLPSSVTSEALSSIPASSKTTVTETHTTYTQVVYSSDSSTGTTEHGSKTLSASGVTTIKTNSASGLATPYPTSDCVWTVYLTMVESVTCSTGVVPETAITTTYVTADGHGGNYRPPVVTLPSGCIGGYQVDASGHSYPVAQPTKGSYGNSPDGEHDQPSVRPTPGSSGSARPGYENGKPHIPAPTVESQSHGNSKPEYSNGQPYGPQSTQGSHANSTDNKYSQPAVSGHVSPSQESNKNGPQPTQNEAATTAISAYGSGAPVYPPVSSAIRHGQAGNSTTFAISVTATEETHAPSGISSVPEEAPSTPVIASGAKRYQGTAWTLITGALIALRIWF